MDDNKRNTGAGIYIIDENYQVVYFNQAFQKLFPAIQIDAPCYRILCKEDEPCQECPLRAENGEGSVFYIKKLEQWMELSVGSIEWPGKGMCSIIISKRISDGQVKEAEQEWRNGEDKDTLTGLCRKQKFFRLVEERIQRRPDQKHCLISIDIEHFKLFNEWYGKEAGDEFLFHIGKYLKNFEQKSNSIAGYLGADDFAVLLPDENENLKYLQEQIMGYVRQYSGSAGFLPAFGVYEITDLTVSVSMMYDRAALAMSSIKGNYLERCRRYDEVMMQDLEESYVLFSEVQRGLKNREFTFYLQPKCNMATGRIVGMESLVRWEHPERGLVSPGAFIPFLEESGFIVKLDIYIWNEVCRYIRKWLDEGKQLLPISVNVSRVDIYTMDVAEYFKNMVLQYNIPQHLLEIEITESDFAEESKIITGVAEQMRSAGFAVLMDDFGSGYSSLNMLKDINVDVLKLDMKFLEMNELSAGKGLGILESIIRMAKLLEMRMIAEGVETEEQVKFLVDMGCLYGQGYYFYKPMPISSFEELLKNADNFDHRGIKARKIGNLGVKDLFNADMFSETMFHNILGGIGFYKISGSNIELMQVNEYYYKVTGSNPIDLEEQRKHIQDRVYEEDRETFKEIFRRADENPLNGGSGDVRRLREDGSIIWVNVRIFFIKEQEDGRLYYGAVSDISGQMDAKKELEKNNQLLQRQNEKLTFMRNHMGMILEYTPNCIGFLVEKEGCWKYEVATDGMLSLLGYEVREYIHELIGMPDGKPIGADGSIELKKELLEVLLQKEEYKEVSKVMFSNTVHWFSMTVRYIKDEEDRQIFLCILGDVTSLKMQEHNLWMGGQKLRSILHQAQISSWSWDMTTHTLTLDNIQQNKELLVDFMGIETEQMVIQNFPESILELGIIGESYRKKVKAYFEGMYKGGISNYPKCEFPMRRKDGSTCWVRTMYELVEDEDGNPVEAIGYYLDITREIYLTKLAQTDAMTGLYNRNTAKPKVEEYLNVNDGKPSVVVMFDLDNFKAVNDVFGHMYGDHVIQKNASKLREIFQKEDIICRMGGDEFLVLCIDITEEQMRERLKTIITELPVTYHIEEKAIKLSVSAGYALFPEDGTTFDELYEKADIALFCSKMNGKGIFRRYDASMKDVRYELADPADILE